MGYFFPKRSFYSLRVAVVASIGFHPDSSPDSTAVYFTAEGNLRTAPLRTAATSGSWTSLSTSDFAAFQMLTEDDRYDRLVI